jgi:hypothetical protein
MAFVKIVIIKWLDFPTKNNNFQVINENAQINDELLSNYRQNVDANIEYFIPTIPLPELDYDASYYDLKTVKTTTIIPSAEYANLNQYQTTYELIEKPVEQSFLVVDNAEKIANDSVVSQSTDIQVVSGALGVCIKLASGLTLTDDEQAIIDDFLNKNDQIKSNHDLAISLKQTIQEGGKPNIEAAFSSRPIIIKLKG